MNKSKETTQQEKMQSPEEILKASWIETLRANKDIQAYFSNFNAASIEHFESHYVSQKFFWVTYGPHYTERMESEGIKWIEEAFFHLKLILQKKLFDAQCLWRAEQLTIKEIELSHDFRCWEENILNCPFIEPLTEEDVELYRTFLQTVVNDFEPESFFDCNWQDYEEIINSYTDPENADYDFPEWYEFCNVRKGTAALMLLPDIRGEKEQFYIDMHDEIVNEEIKENYKVSEECKDKRKWLYLHESGLLDWFVDKFEPNDIKIAYNSFKWSNKDRDKEDEMKDYMELLFSAEETLPIETNANWMDGIKKAAIKYKHQKIAEALPLAWEQYKMNIDMGIGFPLPKTSYGKPIAEMFKTTIITGRILNGEPGDLNF